jgi:hypothetical protein
MKKQETTLQRLKEQVDTLARFWCGLSVELATVDLTARKTVERLDQILAPHIDGHGFIQGPTVKAPLVWLEDLLNDWPEFCPVCGEVGSACQCQGDQ